MAAHPLLPNPAVLTLDSLSVRDDVIVFAARAVVPGATCPCCEWLSERVHSWYRRTLLDLPWQGNAVKMVLTVRKLFCDNQSCERRVFAERLPAVAQRYARKTCRLADALRELTYLAGGEAAARIARTFGLLISPDALLESLRRSSLPAPAATPPVTPRVLGVDDFAFKRGRLYGTILIDLERRCPVDLLPDRESTTLERWLTDHPGVEIVSRDRANCYAEGVRAGAPRAVQVADRWHLLKNVGDTLEKLFIRKHHLLREVASRSESDAPQLQQASLPSREAEQTGPRRERQLARYNQILDLHGKGVTISGIQRLTGADPKTIRKYLKSNGLPERQPRCCSKSGKLTAFQHHVEQRWSEGCHSGAQLLSEIRALGYRGGYTTLRDFLQPRRARAALLPTAKRLASAPSPRRLAWLVTNRAHPRARAQDITFLDALASACSEVKQAMEAAQSLCALIRERRARAPEELDTWLTTAQQSGVTEIKTLAWSLQMDRGAVAAALSLPWSNGQVEGQVNRLKFLKRSMYGSASFGLLRARVLPFRAATVIVARPA